MKTKRFDKKLHLKKRTIAILDHNYMSEIKGGEFTVVMTNCAACSDLSKEVCIPTVCRCPYCPTREVCGKPQ